MGHPEFYEPETLKRLQGEILSILDDFTAICDRYHLPAQGSAPSATGASFPGTMTLTLPCRGRILSG